MALFLFGRYDNGVKPHRLKFFSTLSLFALIMGSCSPESQPASTESQSISTEQSTTSSASSSSNSSTPSPEPKGYYKNVDWSLTGAALKTALFKTISTGTKDVGYNGLLNAYKTTDITSNGTVWDMYSNERYVYSSGFCGSYSEEGDGFNREHTIPQSIFSKNSPMRSDLFHVYPTDAYVNNKRSNYPHGNVSTATYTSHNGGKLGKGNNHGYNKTVFEVVDEYKGDFARTYFYFVTRYQDKMADWSYDAFSRNSFPSLASWAIQTYLEWNDKDPVSEKEIKRNEAVYGIQKNRNPFIDNPDAAHAIWDRSYQLLKREKT